MTALKDKINYLKDIYDEENARQPVIEGKCSQNIANSGIFLTLIGLMIGILSNNQATVPVWVKIVMACIIAIITILNVVCIIYALSALDPIRYPYSRGNPENVNQFPDISAFEKEVITDYIDCIQNNMILNNKKATYLVKSRIAYVVSIYLTGLFTVFLIAYITFLNPNAPEKIQKIEIINLKSKSNH